MGRLLPQSEIILNLLRQSNASPNVSAYAQLSGPLDYNKMPLAPIGCKVQVQKKADKWGTWAYHSINGWYLSASPEYYQTHVCHIKHTSSERLSDTVQFKHKNITNPSLTHANKIMRALSHCIQELKGAEATTTEQELRDIQQLIDVTQAHLQSNKTALPTWSPGT